MEGSFSESVLSRLPAAVQKLDPVHQKAFIHLRLRKREEEISGLLAIPLDETHSVIDRVKQVLAEAGLLDMVEDPQFVSIHSPGPDPEQELQLHSFDLPIENKIIINEFLSALKNAVSNLPKPYTNILRLRYNQQMSAKEILDFSKKLGISLINGKDFDELTEQDIFYLLNKALKELLKELRKSYGEDSFMYPDGLKDILTEIEI